MSPPEKNNGFTVFESKADFLEKHEAYFSRKSASLSNAANPLFFSRGETWLYIYIYIYTYVCIFICILILMIMIVYIYIYIYIYIHFRNMDILSP